MTPFARSCAQGVLWEAGKGKGSGLNEILNPAGDLFIIRIRY